jgi:hypothetical protein
MSGFHHLPLPQSPWTPPSNTIASNVVDQVSDIPPYSLATTSLTLTGVSISDSSDSSDVSNDDPANFNKEATPIDEGNDTEVEEVKVLEPPKKRARRTSSTCQFHDTPH